MHHHLTSHRFAALTLALIALAIIPIAVLAQDAQPPGQTDQVNRPTLDLDFPGGSAAAYIAAIRKAQPEANIVTLGELEKVLMPAVRLHRVDVASAVHVLKSIPNMQGDLVVNVDVRTLAAYPERPILNVVAEVTPRSKPGAARTQETIVVSLADLLGENLKPADALTAIETALDLIKADYEPAQIKFHEETGLLIARGSEEQTSSIMQVVQQLRERAGTIRSRKDQEAMVQHQQQNIGEAMRDARELRERYDMLTHEVTQWRTKSDLLQQEIDAMRKMTADLEGENRQLRAEYARLAGGKPPSGDKPDSDGSHKPQ